MIQIIVVNGRSVEITGSAQELRDLANTLVAAVNDGESEAQIHTGAGVAPIYVLCED